MQQILKIVAIISMAYALPLSAYAADGTESWSVGDIRQNKSYYAPTEKSYKPLNSKNRGWNRGAYSTYNRNLANQSRQIINQNRRGMNTGRYNLEPLDLSGLNKKDPVRTEPNLQPNINRETKSQEARAAREYRTQMRETRRDWAD